MRINASSNLTEADVQDAITLAWSHGQDIRLTSIATSPRGAITFYCHSDHGRFATNRDDGKRAATWTAWGYVIAELFARDPSAVIGQYRGADNFREQIERARQIYFNREAVGVPNRKDGPGENVSFLTDVPA